jgi:hypothetical protein
MIVSIFQPRWVCTLHEQFLDIESRLGHEHCIRQDLQFRLGSINSGWVPFLGCIGGWIKICLEVSATPRHWHKAHCELDFVASSLRMIPKSVRYATSVASMRCTSWPGLHWAMTVAWSILLSLIDSETRRCTERLRTDENHRLNSDICAV